MYNDFFDLGERDWHFDFWMGINALPKNPSTIDSVFWLFAHDPDIHKEDLDYRYIGKWLLFHPISEIDEKWNIIKEETEAGRLTFQAKVSTAKPNRNATDPDIKVMCVYTQDYRDETDVMRIRELLRKLGYDYPIPYKTDVATREKRYAYKGQKTSLYFC